MDADASMNDATDYSQAFAAKPQPLTLEQAAWITLPMQAVDTEEMIDVPRMRRSRQNRLREQIRAQGFDAIILVEPLSIRYATGVRNCTLIQMHIQAGYLFMPADGPVVYFDLEPGRNTCSTLGTIDEIRDDLLPLPYMFAGPRHAEWARRWAVQLWCRYLARLPLRPGRPSDYQKSLYTMAHTEVMENSELVQSGAAYSDIALNHHLPPAGFGDQPYLCMMHGLGMADEWPVILHSPDHPDFYDGALVPGMVICVECYIGEIGGVEGVKLEDMVLVTESGPVTLSRYPYEEELMTKEV